MTGHEDTGVEFTCVCTVGSLQQFQAVPVVIIRKEARLSVIATG